MQKGFNFSLISSETMISVSWQLRSQACLKISENKNTLRVQALISHVLSPHTAMTLPLPTAFRGAGQWLLIQANCKPGLPAVDAIQNIETVCSLCTSWSPNQLYFCCLHLELWNRLLFFFSVWPHLQLWLYLLMPAVTHLGFTEHPEQAEGYTCIVK